jgi:hypothetical protein
LILIIQRLVFNASIKFMNQMRNTENQKPIALLLLVTVFVLFVLPVHIHLHHDLNMEGHGGHVVDYHMILDDVDHLSQGDLHVFETTADSIFKQSTDNLFKIVALAVLLLVMSLQTLLYYQRRYHPLNLNYQKYYSLSPPLRAPPL